MPRLLCFDVGEAVVGKTEGYWLSSEDFVSTSALPVKQLGKLGFPRDFPNVYSTSKVLKSLIGKKGSCAGKMVSVSTAPLPEEVAKLPDKTFHPLQSFSNAEVVEKATGWPVVQGWIVWEQWELATSEGFVAERYWWNRMPDNKWVDFTPRPADCDSLLLAEAAAGAPKSRSTLSDADKDLFILLLRERFPAVAAKFVVEDASPPAQPAQMVEPAAPAEPAQLASGASPEPAVAPPVPETASETKTAGDIAIPRSLLELVQRVRSEESDALKELHEKLRGDEDLCVKATASSDGIAKPLVSMLSDSSKREESLKLLLVVTDAGVNLRRSDVGGSIIAAGAVAPLLRLIEEGSPGLQESAAAVLGNICHESPCNQQAVAQSDIFGPLVKLLDADTGPAQEAAYAIWNLTVGHEENSQKVVKLGVVPKLAKLLHDASDVAQENAAGALMHVTVCEEARLAIKSANAIPRLCELLKSSHEPEVSSQAAGALLNLASDSSEYSALIVKEGAVGPLVNLVRDGPELAREYSAGALMNLTRGDMEVAEKAAKDGAIKVLADLLAKPTGHSEALGALANLASGSPARQVEIFKCQITRKCVRMLTDQDTETRRCAAALIMNLAPHPKIKERIVEASALKPLAQLLEDDDDVVKERAAGALANLFNDHAANVTKGFEEAPNMISSLVSVMSRTASEDAQRQAAHALAMLAAEDAPCEKVWDAKAKGPFMDLLRRKVAEAALGIMNLAWRCPEKKKELAEDGAIELLLDVLHTGDTMAKEYAAGALMNMTASAPEAAKLCVSALPEFAGLLSQGVQAAEWAAGAIANIAGKDAEAQKAAVAAGAVPGLAALLSQVSVSGRPLTVLALAALAESDAPAVRKALGASQKAKLKEFRDSGNKELHEQVKELVEQIGGGFSL